MVNKMLKQHTTFKTKSIPRTPYNLSALLDSRHWAAIGKLCPEVNKANDTSLEFTCRRKRLEKRRPCINAKGCSA
jgi:hypothetical protein